MNPTKYQRIRGEFVQGIIRLANGIRLVHFLQRWPALYRPLRAAFISSCGGTELREIIAGPLAGYHMAISTHDRIAYLINTHEPDIVRLASELCQPGMRVLDVGAHVGYFSLLFSVRVGPTGHVTTLEPNPGNVSKILAMVAANCLTNIEVCPLAASDVDGRVDFVTEDSGQMGHIISNGQAGRTSVISVQATRIDSLCAQQRLGKIDLVKLDVEGAEAKALTGMAGLLARCRPLVICEWHPQAAGSDYSGVFRRLGYACELLEPSSDITPFHLIARPGHADIPLSE